MQYYYTRQALPGVPANTVERFADRAAAPLVISGALARFDSRKREHAEAPGAESVPADQRRPPALCPTCGVKQDR